MFYEVFYVLRNYKLLIVEEVYWSIGSSHFKHMHLQCLCSLFLPLYIMKHWKHTDTQHCLNSVL